MSMKDFVDTLTEEQRAALMEALGVSENKNEPPEDFATQEPEEEVPEMPNDFTMKRSKINTMKQNGRREKVQASQNQWVDNGNDHKDIKTPNTMRTPRNRKPPKKKNVVCHVCGKKQEVTASLVYGEFYRCDRCTG